MQGITAFGSVLCQFDLTIYASFKGFEIPAEQVKAFFDVWHYFKEGSGNQGCQESLAAFELVHKSLS
jgi:hypothetical protein